MKWRPLQREGTDVAADASPSALAANLTTHTLDDPLGAPGWPDLLSPSNFVSVPSLSIRPRPPEPLLLTKDIEALLEEDARRRPSALPSRPEYWSQRCACRKEPGSVRQERYELRNAQTIKSADVVNV